MRISVIVPAYNEEATVAQVLESLSKVPLDLEVIVVDDASTDRTWKILQELRQKEPFDTYRYIRHDFNQGKGAGLRTGFGLVSGDIVTVQDADMEYNPQDLPALVYKWEEVGDPKVAIYGCRDLSYQKFTTRWGNRFLTAVTNILYGCHIHDMETCYKMMPGPLARALPMEGRRFEIEPEIRSSHQLHSAQREKTFALEGWVACPGDAAAPPFHKTLSVYRAHSNQCGGEANLEKANLERATLDLAIRPAALGGASPAPTFLGGHDVRAS